MTKPKPLLRDLAPADIAGLALRKGLPAWRVTQLCEWLFRHGVFEWEDMTNLPAALRDELAADYDLCGASVDERLVSTDGTRKFLFKLRDDNFVESVLIPMQQKATFCLSSQVGCAMACNFCATARGGLARDLSAGEIIEQVLRLRADLAGERPEGHGDRGFNLVFMGMGEPLENWSNVGGAITTLCDAAGLAMSPRRITVSTCGHEAGLERLEGFPLKVGLTLSLGSVSQEGRRRLMPVAGRTPLKRTLDLVEAHARRIERDCTLAYVMIAGRNDSADEARRLAELARGRPFKVNLIPLNRIEDDRSAPASRQSLEGFQDILRRAGIQANIRHSGGQDIDAACGQLRRRRQQGQKPRRHPGAGAS